MHTINTTRPTELALASYGSPLRKPIIGWGLAVALLALCIFALAQIAPVFDLTRPARFGVLLLALLVIGLITLIPLLLLRWLDRREPEPWFMVGLALLWGGLIATGISLDVNHMADKVLGGMLGAILSGPFIEEAAKGLGLLVFLLLLRSEFDGPRDGFIYGALIGLGFNWLESAVYIAQGFSATGVAPWAFQLSSRYALLGLGGHALYTSITGTFIGFALLQKSFVRRLTLPLLGYLLAALSHMTWNSLGIMLSGIITTVVGSLVLGESGRAIVAAGDPAAFPVWVSWPANAIATIMAGFVAYLIVIIGLRRSARWEKSVMVEQLQDELDSPVVTAAEYADIQARCEPPTHDKAARQRFVAQCNLAKRKFFLTLHNQPVDNDPLVAIWRDEAQTLHKTTH